MRNKLIVVPVLIVTLLAFSGSAFAHHGAAAYDIGKNTTLTGTATNFEFVNPHVLITIDVKDASGKVTSWKGELTSPNRLTRAGWTKSTIKPGDQITITGGTSKSGSNTMWINKVLKNGEEIQLGAE
jgi:Family of unknown function (DUF6152)